MDKISVKEYLKSEINELIENELNTIKNDSEFYALIKEIKTSSGEPVTNKIVKENIDLFQEYRIDYNYCKNCPGFEACDKECKHSRLCLEFYSGLLQRKYKPCELLNKRTESMRKILINDAPTEWENLKPDVNDKTRKEASYKMSEIFHGKSSLSGIYLMGLNGVGKSFIAYYLAKWYVNKKDDSVFSFIDCSSRFKYLADLDKSYDEYKKDEFNKQLNQFINTDVLVMDGFGNELKNDYVRDRILLPLLSERLKNKRITIITSNYSIREIAEMYSISRRASLHPAAQRLEDLLIAICEKEIEILTSANLYK